MTLHPNRVPLRPDYSAVTPTSKGFWRTVAKEFLTRTASSPLTSSSGMALVPVSMAQLITGLVDESAAMQLFAACAQVDFAGVELVIIPRVVSSTVPIFVPEGASGSVVQSVLDASPFGPPCKFLFAAVLTNEIIKYTADTIATVIQKGVAEKAAIQLDTVVFDSTAATAGTRPAGLLYGVSDLGPTAGGGLAALTGDLAKIAGAMADAAVGTSDLFIFANPRQAIVMRGLLSPSFARNYTIVGTPAVADKTIVGVAPRAVVTGFSGEPTFEFTGQGTVHMEGATPGDITTATVATSIKSLWQSDLLAARLRMRLSWAPLITGAVQKIVSVSW